MSTNIQSPFSNAGVGSLTAADSSITVGGTATAPTVALATPVTIARGGTGAATASAALTALGGLVNQAATGIAGYTLVNGTGNIITWTPPNDGAVHWFMVLAAMHVSSSETGGAIQVSFTTPDGSIAATHTLFAAGATGPGDVAPAGPILYACAANIAVVVKQGTALTAGASVMWASIWGL